MLKCLSLWGSGSLKQYSGTQTFLVQASWLWKLIKNVYRAMWLVPGIGSLVWLHGILIPELNSKL